MTLTKRLHIINIPSPFRQLHQLFYIIKTESQQKKEKKWDEELNKNMLITKTF